MAEVKCRRSKESRKLRIRPVCKKGHLLDAEVTIMAAWRGEEDAIRVCLS